MRTLFVTILTPLLVIAGGVVGCGTADDAAEIGVQQTGRSNIYVDPNGYYFYNDGTPVLDADGNQISERDVQDAINDAGLDPDDLPDLEDIPDPTDNTGSGNNPPAGNPPAGGSCAGQLPELADLDGDGCADAIVNCDGDVMASPQLTTCIDPNNVSFDPLTGDVDIDGDGQADFNIHTGSGSGTNPPAGGSCAGQLPELADLDGNGCADSVVDCDGNVMASPGSTTCIDPNTVSFDPQTGDVDIDGDGQADLNIYSGSGNNPSTGNPSTGGSCAGQLPELADLDGDGCADSVVNCDGDVIASAQLTTCIDPSAVSFDPQTGDVDIDGDGQADFNVHTPGNPNGCTPELVYYNDGTACVECGGQQVACGSFP